MTDWHRLLVTHEQLAWLRAESCTTGKSIGEVVRELLAMAMTKGARA